MKLFDADVEFLAKPALRNNAGIFEITEQA
jgi:hypothetical protein